MSKRDKRNADESGLNADGLESDDSSNGDAHASKRTAAGFDSSDDDEELLMAFKRRVSFKKRVSLGEDSMGDISAALKGVLADDERSSGASTNPSEMLSSNAQRSFHTPPLPMLVEFSEGGTPESSPAKGAIHVVKPNPLLGEKEGGRS